MNVFPGYIHKTDSPNEEGDISMVWRIMLTSGNYILKGTEEVFPGGPLVEAPELPMQGREFDPWSGTRST